MKLNVLQREIGIELTNTKNYKDHNLLSHLVENISVNVCFLISYLSFLKN